MEIGLVSCTKAKEDSASTPRELYEPSALFRKARSYVEENHDVWYVLSVKYNVLDPDGSPIEPYDETLNNAGVEERREWSRAVVGQLRKRDLLAEGNTLVIHAGKAYWLATYRDRHDDDLFWDLIERHVQTTRAAEQQRRHD